MAESQGGMDKLDPHLWRGQVLSLRWKSNNFISHSVTKHTLGSGSAVFRTQETQHFKTRLLSYSQNEFSTTENKSARN